MKKLLISLFAVLPLISAAQISPSWKPFLEIKSSEDRVHVLEAMSEHMNDYTRCVVVGALTDPSRNVVDTAIRVLRVDHCPATFHALVAGLPKGSQYEAALLLANYREPRYIETMAKLLKHE